MRKILTLSRIAATGAFLMCAPAFAQVTHTVTSNPVGRTITVDSATCTTPCTYSWTAGTVHTVVAAGPQAGATGVQYVYASWSDFGTATHNVTAQSSPMTYTANFTTQYYLTTAANPTAGGTVTPASGWYNSGTVVTVSGTPASGYQFTNYSGDLTGTTSWQSLTMSAPRSVNGYFGGSLTQTYATAGTYTWIPPAGVVAVQVQVWGGGGGGGLGTLSGYEAYGGGGGGGGGYTAAAALSVNPGSSYTIVVGAGGAGTANGAASSALGNSAGGGGAGRMADTFDGSGGGSGGGGGSALYPGYAGGQGYYSSTNWYCSDDDCNDWYPESWGNGGPGGANGLGAYTAGAGGTGGSVQLNSGYSAPGPGTGHAGQVLLTYAVTGAPLLTQTITSSPVGRTLTVDGTTCTTPCSLQWNAGTSHTIAAAATQAGSAGTQYLFASWSDSGAASHTVSPSVATTYTANLTTQYQLTTSNSPATAGTITPATGNWYNAGTVVTLSETPASGFTFVNYTNTGGTLSAGTITMSGAAAVTANFTAPNVSNTIASNPVGRTITVDSVTCTTPCTYSWMPGTVHTVVAAGPQAGALGVQYVYANWSDSGTATHNITTSFTPPVYTANFTTQYYLTTAGSPTAGGTLTPASGWYNSGTVLTVTAAPAAGYQFTRFAGDLTGTTTPQSLTMSTTRSVNGYFGGSLTQTYATGGTYTWTAPAGVFSLRTVQVWGGGGGGGLGETYSSDSYGGGGGGGGAYAVATSLSVTPGNNYTIVIGAGGAGGVGGGTTSVLGYSANGGAAGNMGWLPDGNGNSGGYGGSGGAGASPNGGYGADGGYTPAGSYCVDSDPDTGWCIDWETMSSAGGGAGGASGSGGYTAGAGGAGASVQVNTGYASTPAATGHAGQVLLTYAVDTAVLLTQTITSSPVGRTLTVDGSICTTPCSMQWYSGTNHTIAAAATQAGSAGTQYLFASWSDSGAATHFIAPTVATTFTANLTTQYQLTTVKNPASGGTMTPASGSWYNAGTVVTLSETPASGYTFVNYTNTGGTLSGATITMSGPATATANFTAPQANHTITANPVGLTITVDSATCTTPCTYSWVPGTVHTVAAAGPQAATAGVQYVYANWSDGGTATHSVTAQTTATTYTAGYAAQYYLTTLANPPVGGALTPASGWYDTGAVVAVTGLPASGYQFSNFSGDLTGGANPQNLTMSAPRTVTGYFGGSQTQTYASAGTFTWTAPPGVFSVQTQIWGGGGGGASGTADGSYNAYGGGGGGGGGYVTAAGLSVTPGSNYTIVVGAGGSAGASGGGTSALGISAGGGNGGNAGVFGSNSGGTGGAGGSGGTHAGYPGGAGYYGAVFLYCGYSDSSGCLVWLPFSWAGGGTAGLSGSGGYMAAGSGGMGGNVQINTGSATVGPSPGYAGQVLLTYGVYTPPPLTQAITSSPVGLTLTVDGTNCTTPCSVVWGTGTSHVIAAPATQAGIAGTQYLFATWSDSGAASHTVAPTVSTTYTANLTTQHQLTTVKNPASGGTMTPASGAWYNAGTVVTLSETPAGGFTFANYFANYSSTGGIVSGSTVTMSGAATVTATFTSAGQTSQTTTFAALADKVWGTVPFTVSASASSGLSVSFASTTTGVCTVSGNTVTVVSAGSCSITASQAGNSAYAAAPDVARPFTVAKAPQTITFGTPGDVTYGVGQLGLSATASSGLAVSFTSTTTAKCTVSGSIVTVVAAGTCSITASQGGTSNILAAVSVTRSFTIIQAPTTTVLSYVPSGTSFVFRVTTSPSAATGTVEVYDLTAQYAYYWLLTGGVGTLPAVLLSPGAHTLFGAYLGDANYQGSASQTVSVFAGGASQTISFGALSNVAYGVSPITVSPTASPSGLTVSLAASSPAVCTVAGMTITVTGVGVCTITATQPGNATYAAAPSVSQSFTVNQATQTITLNLPGSVAPNSNFTLGATASSGLPVSYSVGSPCTVVGVTVTVGAAGTSCSVTGNQPGNANYVAATSITGTVTVATTGSTSQTITFGTLSDQALSSTPPALSATASSGLQVSFASNTITVCAVSGTTLTLLSTGNCSITASQAGNATFAPATPVARSFTVTTLPAQTITFTQVQTSGTPPFALSANSNSGLTVAFASNSPSVCTVSGVTVMPVATGSCSITATQAGNGSWAPATPVTQIFAVAAQCPTALREFIRLGANVIAVENSCAAY